MKEDKAQNISSIKLAKPAQRALHNAGIATLKQLSRLSEKGVSELHGIGQNAIVEIKKTLTDNGVSFIQEKNRSRISKTAHQQVSNF